ncbi:MAG TPA: tetraacyldisaccharide 4'-kinase [Candidatus Binataceae bacterium]
MAARSVKSVRPPIERLWGRHLSPLELALWLPLAPAGIAYRVALGVRNRFWRYRSRHGGVLTISVGNLTVGGSGKTPFAMFLAARLEARGLKVGIASRGYGRKGIVKGAVLVADGGELKVAPRDAGDEPVMMAKSFAGPIAVARRRIDAVELLKSECHVDAVILDDGFQHISLERDVDLLLVNVSRGFGNEWPLPAGPMREPLSAAKRADAVILVSSGVGHRSRLRESQMEKLGHHRSLHTTVRPRALLSPEQGQWRELPATLTGRRVLAVSGLADASAFYTMLRDIDADLVGVLEYPDHHRYGAADWQDIVAAARNADVVVTTEKDLVKLEQFPFARDSLYALRIEVKMAEEDARVLDELIFKAADRPDLLADAQRADSGTR